MIEVQGGEEEGRSWQVGRLSCWRWTEKEEEKEEEEEEEMYERGGLEGKRAIV